MLCGIYWSSSNSGHYPILLPALSPGLHVMLSQVFWSVAFRVLLGGKVRHPWEVLSAVLKKNMLILRCQGHDGILFHLGAATFSSSW